MAKEANRTKGGSRRGRSGQKATTEMVMGQDDIARRAFAILPGAGRG